MAPTSFTGKILCSYDDGPMGELGEENWEIVLHPDGLQSLRARCLLHAHPPVFRDILQTAHPDYHPHDGYARIVVDGKFRGSAWYRFSDTLAECESQTMADGRISQTFPIYRGIRGFGTHALQSDAWLGAHYDVSQGPGEKRFFNNLMITTDHRGSTGPMFMTTNSTLKYWGIEEKTVPAGTFQCHRFSFEATSHNHPPYNMWTTTDGRYVFVYAEFSGQARKRVYHLVDFTAA